MNIHHIPILPLYNHHNSCHCIRHHYSNYRYHYHYHCLLSRCHRDYPILFRYCNRRHSEAIRNPLLSRYRLEANHRSYYLCNHKYHFTKSLKQQLQHQHDSMISTVSMKLAMKRKKSDGN